MPIKVICVCGKKFSVKDELAGKKVKCPACQKVLNLSKATAEKLSPKDQSDFEKSANKETGKGQDQALEQFVGMMSGEDGSATSKNKSAGGDAAGRRRKTKPEAYDPCASQLRSVRASKVREGISCYFFGFLVIFFVGCWAACAPTLYQGDLPKLIRVLRGLSFVGLVAEVIMAVGFGLCLTAPSKIRGRDSLLVAVIGGVLGLVVDSLTLWNPMYSLRIGPWLPQFVLMTTHAAFFLFLRWLGEFLGRSEITSRATRVLVLLGIGAAIWLGVFRAQPPMPNMMGRNAILTSVLMSLLYFALGIVALIGLFCVIRLLSRCREILRTDERAATDLKAARENGSANGESKWLSRSDVLKLAIGGGVVAVSFWGWLAFLRPIAVAFPMPPIRPGVATVAATPGKKTLTLIGHGGIIWNLAFSPDWSRMATASFDKTIKIWDGTTFKELRALTSHTDQVRRVVFSPDGKRLASASMDKSVKLWDADSGKELRTMKGHTGAVLSVTFSPDGQRLASCSDDKMVKLWDATTGRELLTFKGHTQAVTSVAFSSDGKRLASSGNEVRVCDSTSGQELLVLQGHTALVGSVTFRPDGQQFATASHDGTVKLWNAVTGQQLHTLVGHLEAVLNLAYSPDGQRLASLGVDMKLKEWDSASGHLLHTFQTTSSGSVTFSPDGQRVAVAHLGGLVEIWDRPPTSQAAEHHGHTGTVTSVAFSPDSQWSASTSVDRTVKLWNASTGQESHTLVGHTVPVQSVTFSSDGTSLLSVGGNYLMPGEVKQWNVSSGQESGKSPIPATRLVAISPEGTHLASPNVDLILSIPPGKEQTLKLWDVASGKELQSFKGHLGPMTSVALSSDGNWLASAGGTFGKPGEIKLWNASSGNVTHQWATPTSGSTRVAISPDGRRLTASNPDRTVKVWDTINGQELFSIKPHTYPTGCMAFSPDGRWLASGSGLLPTLAGELKLWDAATGQEKLTLKGHARGINFVTFSPDGTRLASASTDETIKVWDTTTGRELLLLGTPAQ